MSAPAPIAASADTTITTQHDTHIDAARPTFGYVADPRDFYTRASRRQDVAALTRDRSACHLADVVIGPAEEQWALLLQYAADSYRRSVTALVYAEGVYEVEAAKVRATARSA